jgi:hypothetical protein
MPLSAILGGLIGCMHVLVAVPEGDSWIDADEWHAEACYAAKIFNICSGQGCELTQKSLDV